MILKVLINQFIDCGVLMIKILFVNLINLAKNIKIYISQMVIIEWVL